MATEQNSIETKVTLDATQAQQEIAKLNAVASDGTKTLEERVAAKNKQLELTEKLNKQQISSLEKQVASLTGVVGKEKELERATKKLNATRLKSTKQETALIKQSNGLQSALNGSKGAVNNLNNATGGLITSFTALAANPIVLMITGLIGLIKLLKEAFTSSEEGQNKWNKAVAVTEALLGNLLDLVAELAEWLVGLFEDPQKALDDFASMLKENVINRFEGLLELVPRLGQAVGLLFEGKFSEAGKVAVDAVGKVTTGMDSVTESIDKAKEALNEFIAEQEEEAASAARVADMRAKADKIERNLIVQKSIQEAKIADLRLKSRQEEQFSATERKAFLAEALKLGDDLLGQEVEYLELRRDAQILENTFSRSNKENLTAEAEAIAAVNRQQTARANLARQIETENKRVTGQIRTESKKAEAEEKKRLADIAKFKKGIAIEEEQTEMEKIEARKDASILELENLRISEQEKTELLLGIEAKFQDDLRQLKEEEAVKTREAEALIAQANRDAQNELDQLEIERKREIGESTLALEKELLQKKMMQELSNTELTETEKKLIKEKYQKATEQLDKIEVASNEAKEKEVVNNAIAGAGEVFGIQQELAVATAIMNAPEAVSSSFAKAAEVYAPPLSGIMGALGAASVLVPIVKGLADIKKVRFSGAKKRGGGGSISTSASAPNIPEPTGIGQTAVTDLTANNAAMLGADNEASFGASAAASANVQGAASGNVVFSEAEYNNFQNQVGFIEGQSTIG